MYLVCSGIKLIPISSLHITRLTDTTHTITYQLFDISILSRLLYIPISAISDFVIVLGNTYTCEYIDMIETQANTGGLHVWLTWIQNYIQSYGGEWKSILFMEPFKSMIQQDQKFKQAYQHSKLVWNQTHMHIQRNGSSVMPCSMYFFCFVCASLDKDVCFMWMHDVVLYLFG